MSITNSQGATDQLEGKTPVFFKLKREHEYLVRISLEGYQPKVLKLSKKPLGWVILGNIFSTIFLGLAVDAMTGALYKLEPVQLSTTLAPNSASRNTKDSIYLVTVLEPEDSWIKIGQLPTD